MNPPSFILILCEGITEKLYFESIIHNMRIGGVDILENQGQHKALIDKCIKERKKCSEKNDIDEDNIEVWAVCDHDGMKISYQELLEYASERNVKLAFSKPRFEAYLLQHFCCRKNIKEKDLDECLSKKVLEYCGNEYSKSNLGWIDGMIDYTPQIVESAIRNANSLNNHTDSSFLTVQKLVERLVNLKK